MRNKLTAVGIKNAPDGRHFDGAGLWLHKSGDGGRWVWRYTRLGKRREMGLGSLSDTTLAEARKRRDQWQAVLAAGDDPIDRRNALEAAEKAARTVRHPTLEEMALEVYEAKKPTLRGDGERGRWYSPLRLYVIPKLGRKAMRDITAADIRDTLKPIWKSKHPTAEKALQRTHIIFRQARLEGIECDPFMVDQARHMLGHVVHQPAHIVATRWQDVPALYARLPHSAAGLCLRWLILTQVRLDGCRGARFCEIEGDVWTVPAERIKGQEGKVKPFRVPVTQEASRVAKLAREYSSDYLFPSYREGRPITSTAVEKALNVMGEAGRPHGFRTSFRAWVQDTGATTYDVAETILGHQIGGKVERAYARSDILEQRRAVLAAWADYVRNGK